MSNVNTIMNFPSLCRVWVYCCSAPICCFSDLEKSGFSYFWVCLFCFHENIELKRQKGCFDMFLIKSADTALQNVSPVFCLTVIGCRIFYAGPLNFAFTPPLIGIICHIHSEISEKHIWKYAHWASDAFFASIVSLTANSRTSTNKWRKGWAFLSFLLHFPPCPQSALPPWIPLRVPTRKCNPFFLSLSISPTVRCDGRPEVA